MTNYEIKMLLNSRLEKKAGSLEEHAVGTLLAPYLKSHRPGKLYRYITNPSKPLGSQFIDWLANYTPEGIRLRKRYDKPSLLRTPYTVNTVFNISERLKSPITDNTHINNGETWARQKAWQRFDQYYKEGDLRKFKRAKKAFRDSSTAPRPTGPHMVPHD